MSDLRVRQLQRRWEETNALEDEAAWLAERIRAGEITGPQAKLAAAVGHPAAELVTGGSPGMVPKSLVELTELTREFASAGRTSLLLRVGIACAEACNLSVGGENLDLALANSAVDSAKAWLSCPCEDHENQALIAESQAEGLAEALSSVEARAAARASAYSAAVAVAAADSDLELCRVLCCEVIAESLRALQLAAVWAVIQGTVVNEALGYGLDHACLEQEIPSEGESTDSLKPDAICQGSEIDEALSRMEARSIAELACQCARSVQSWWSAFAAEDPRPQEAIQSGEGHLLGLVTREQISLAISACEEAAEDAEFEATDSDSGSVIKASHAANAAKYAAMTCLASSAQPTNAVGLALLAMQHASKVSAFVGAWITHQILEPSRK